MKKTFKKILLVAIGFIVACGFSVLPITATAENEQETEGMKQLRKLLERLSKRQERGKKQLLKIFWSGQRLKLKNTATETNIQLQLKQ